MTSAAVVTVMALLLAVAAGPQKSSSATEAGRNDSPVSTAKVVSFDTKQAKKASLGVAASFKKELLPLLSKFCFDCHSGEEAEAGLNFRQFTDEKSILSSQRKWEMILQKVESGTMPPADHEPLPSKEERQRIVKWIDDAIFYVDCDLPPDPGRVTIRRLNRAEYNNTIRDLVGVDFNPAEDFPSDDVGYGFDNIGDVLSVQPLLMEKYLDAAEQIAADAIVHLDPEAEHRRDGDKLQRSEGVRRGRSGFVQMSSNGEVYDRFHFPVEGEYVLRAEASADQAGDEPAKMEFRIDDKKVKVFEIRGNRRRRVYETRFRVEKGERKFAAAFINDYYRPEAKDPNDRDRNLAVRFLEVKGPVDYRYEDLPELHRRIVFVRPDKNKSVKQAAGEILKKFADRAFRRPVSDEELEKFVGLVEMAVNRKESFEQGIRIALQAVLVSPHFLFRVEADAAADGSRESQRISDYQLASRLSYFLWSSMPDDELFVLADRGTLHQPRALEEQVRRMLKDPKSSALVSNFASQWLNLRLLENASPDPEKYPDFNDELRADMRRESELLFEAMMREDRSVLDFLDADFTFLNERLAKHYGISGIKGEKFRRVSLDNGRRAGVLTHAGVLTLTSETARTSPVKRGKWILENILGTPPPPPPPDVPLLEESAKDAKDLPLRKQLEIHRKNPTCASCHVLMDDLGFGFENFDAVGRWRDEEAGRPVDASGKLPSGETFSNPVELVKILRKQDKQFGRCLTEKMLTYALGRGLEYYDRCAVDKILKTLSENEYRFSTLVMEIVRSDPFMRRRNEGGDVEK